MSATPHRAPGGGSPNRDSLRSTPGGRVDRGDSHFAPSCHLRATAAAPRMSSTSGVFPASGPWSALEP
jgi:hypothetical protein